MPNWFGEEGPHGFTPSGLWIAAIGFFVTRFTVTLATFESRTAFLLSGVVPLLLGLLLAASGVALFVGSFDRRFVRSIAGWCGAGTLAMGVLVGLTLTGNASGPGPVGAVRANVVLSNFLIGGAILGALTGVYAGETRRSRAELRQQANRLVTLNRMLRHEVLNAVSIIRGQTEALVRSGLEVGDEDALAPIVRESDRIVDTVEDVKHLARSRRAGLGAVDLRAALADCVATVAEAFPDVEFVAELDDDAVEVWADSQLRHALEPLVENAAAYGGEAGPVVVDLAVGRQVACARISDAGPGLPPEHRATLERGVVADYDDPADGFGVNVARLFVERYGGDIRTAVTDEGTTVEVELARASEARPAPTRERLFASVGGDRATLLAATGAALLGGAVMGAFVQVTAGVIPVIGALYGVADPLVGWLTHFFHSVVFGLVYAGLVGVLPWGRSEALLGRVVVAVGWGLALWLGAAGVIMPIWLNLVGLQAPVPMLTLPALGGHLLWGLTLGVTYHVARTRLFDPA